MTYPFDNPVTRAIRDIDAHIAILTADQVATLEANATLEMRDWLELGDKSSLAMLHGIVELDTANALHMIHERFHNDATLAERIVFMTCMTEILPQLS